MDTSVVVRHLRGSRDAAAFIGQFDSVYLPLVVLGELLYGVQRSVRGTENLALLKRWANGMTLITLTHETSHQYALIKNQLRIVGTPIPENDIWIAAHAMEFDVELACCDSHFERIEGLRICPW